MIELETRAIEDVPVGGVFIGNDNEMFVGLNYTVGYIEPYIRTYYGFSEFTSRHYGKYRLNKRLKAVQVAYTGVIVPTGEYE